LIPVAAPIVAGSGTLGNGCAGWSAAGAVEVFIVAFAVALVPGADAPPQRLGLVETIGIVAPIAATTHAWPGGRCRFVVVEIGRAPRLLGGNTAQTNALVSKEDRRSRQQELTKLQDRVEAPALEKEDAAAKQADGRKKHVVIARQSRLETPHEVEEGSANGQHDPNDAGPVQAGVDHGSRFPFRSL
jgi:hypothetical protein